MSETGDNSEWDRIWSGLADLREWFPQGMVLIGGIAVWLHGKDRLDQRLLEVSHDADFLLSLTDYADLRDLEEVVRNRRLDKHQIIKNGVDFDIYVEQNNSLSIPYDVAAQHAVTLDGYRVLAIEHLLVLKCDAASNRTGAKREKDFRDLARIILLMDAPDADILGPYLTPARTAVIDACASQSSLFVDLAGGNRHEAARLSARFQDNLRAIHDVATTASLRDLPDQEDAQRDDDNHDPHPRP